ncbi:type I polyketide synthase [Pontibaca methylaminivorans]|uniref:type I polyketide synthase n=1 Tax=Pontibaca methylaminivorans TaxID=515897 RepID=UPI002FDB7F0C
MSQQSADSLADEDIAIVGLSLCVPGAGSAETFWSNLRDGVESIEFLDEAALLEAGERPDLIRRKNYVPATARLEGFDRFDAEFFGFSPKEAAILDPQHRKFLETAWEAMENAGHPPESLNGHIGVYGGCGMGSYFYFNICSNRGLVDDVGMFLLRHTGNDKDFMTTRVSHVFDLKGPSVNLQTACSTSLVATHYAVQALRRGDCDMALAGGVTIELPQGRGYLYRENEVLSPDGHCHAFDHRAQGTVFGSGSGVVALRRLSDATRDGDHIWAVIKGSAVNNDGAAKAGYLAPSVDGQAAAITAALANAGVSADTIDYVECHGTGTYLGDPIEISALTEAFRRTSRDSGYCRVGSVKTNIGHLDTAAGVAGLIKTTLALHHRQIPPSLSYEKPNPAIDFETSPFRVADHLTDWESHRGPRRAGINALGVGGTNAHVVLEEAPERPASDESDWPFHVLCISGRSRAALDANSTALAAHLRANPDLDLADVAFTLKEGRRGFERRRVLVAETPQEAADLLDSGDERRVFTHEVLGDAPECVFMFPGGGAQYPDMARDLYETEPVFAEWMDRGLAHLEPQLDYDLRALWLPEPDQRDAAAKALTRPSVQLPLIMIVEYALAQLWMSWGVRPAVLVGHSMGENTAACLAGVMSFEDCIDLVLLRGRLFDRVPRGGMLSVALSREETEAFIGDDLDIATVNAPTLTTVSGPDEALEALARRLTAAEVEFQRIAIDIAAHSRMLDPILDEFRAFLRGLSLQAPAIPIISNRSGQLLAADDATDPDYWVGQLRQPVLFADCITTAADGAPRVFLEVGPGKALSSLARMNAAVKPAQVLASLRHPDQEITDDAYFLGVIGRLWACGINADWAQIWGEARRNRLPLPTYQFQRSRYFIEPGKPAEVEAETVLARSDDLADWGWRPAWRPRSADCDIDVARDATLGAPLTWLFFEDDHGVAATLSGRLEAGGHRILRVRAGDTYAKLGEGRYQLAPEQGRAGYDALIADLEESGALPDRIAHFWLLTRDESFRPGSSFFDRNMEQGFYSLMWLAQSLSGADPEVPPALLVVTNGAAQVAEEPLPWPEKATIAGPAGVIPREFPGLTCSRIDIPLAQRAVAQGFFARLRPEEPAPELDPLLRDLLLEELLAAPGNSTSALRGGRRHEQRYSPVALPEAGDKTDSTPFREGGTYLLTGGFGGIARSIAADLMERFGANIILTSRTRLPERSDWDDHLERHGPANRVSRAIRAVQALEQGGRGRVLPVTADITNPEAMKTAVAGAQDILGPIHGVIHAAGVIDDAPILGRTTPEVEHVLAPKITGLRVLDEIFPDGTLDLMVLCSSSSTATHPAGQIDYVAANEYLNAFARSRRGGATRVLAVDWGVWSDIGMAAEAMAARLGEDASVEFSPAGLPLLDETGFDREGNRIFAARYATRDRWVLNEHRTIDGAALMPGTGYVELAAEAMAARGAPAFRIEDLYFLRALHVPDGTSRDLLLRLVPEDDHDAFAVYSRTADGKGYILHAQAEISPLEDDRPAPLDLDAIAARCGPVQRPESGARLRSPQEAHLKFGPRWHVLRETALGKGEGLARLELPEAARGDAGVLLHPGLLDLATGWAMGLIPGYGARHLWVPVSYQRIRVFAPLPQELISWVRLDPTAPPGEGTVSFDVALSDLSGQVCAVLEGFHMQRMEGALDLSEPEAPDASAADLALEPAPLRPLSADEERLHDTIAQGIRAEEGAEALRRALALDLPQVIVSPLDLDALIAETGRSSSAPEADGQSFDRPDLETSYVAPRNELEKTLAGLFQSLLGIGQVGIQDGFFDLGGHSLIAVRLFAQIKRLYDIQFPISVLFEAPSVEKLAALITAERGVVDAPAAAGAPDEGSAPAGPRHRHVVALHQGKAGQRPFFIVAGMFGNVLNLRQLALSLGKGRPVYGLQARGLIGSDEPHRSLVDAARDYIAEIREVQPEGPYMLGGYSGGGITALEMARQFEAAGETVSLLAFLDTPLPVRPTLSRLDRLMIRWGELREKGPGFISEWAGDRIAWEIQRRRRASERDQAIASETAFNDLQIEAAFRDAVSRYEVAPWQGPLVLFRPPLDRKWRVSGGRWVSSAREYVYPDNDWTRHAPHIEVFEVSGDHDSMVLAPNVATLAQHLRDCIRRAESRPDSRADSRPGGADAGQQPDGWPFAKAAE